MPTPPHLGQAFGFVSAHPLTVARDVRKGLADKRVMTHASAISFQLLFAPIALSLAGLAILSVVGLGDNFWQDGIRPVVRDHLSPAVFKLVDGTVTEIEGPKEHLWLTVGLAIAVWKLSAAARVTNDALDEIYEVLTPAQLKGLRRFRRSLVLGTERQPAGWVSVGTVLVVLAWSLTSLAFGVYAAYQANWKTLFGGFTVAFLVPPSSTSTSARRRPRLRTEGKRAGELGAIGEGGAEPLQITRAQRDRAAASRPAGRVGEAHELLAALRREQLDDAREPLVARPLRHRQLLDDLCGAPRCRGLRHGGDRTGGKRACLCRKRDRIVAPAN